MNVCSLATENVLKVYLFVEVTASSTLFASDNMVVSFIEILFVGFARYFVREENCSTDRQLAQAKRKNIIFLKYAYRTLPIQKQ